MRIAAIIVTYNRKELLLGCIKAVLGQKGSEAAVIVIDNNSTDGTENAIKKYSSDKRVIYYNTGSNLGGAGGFQYGIRKGVELGYDYLWIMDDDCVPSEAALDALVSTAKELNDQFGFLSSKVLWKDGSICKMNVQRAQLTKNVEDFNIPLIPVVMASFVSLFVRSEVVRELGLPIKEFFIWTDDWEFTRRISKSYSCYVVTNSEVTHYSKVNIPADVSSDSADRLERFRYLYRNDVVLYRREGLKGFLYECARLLFHSTKVVFKAKDHRRKRLGMIWKGTMAGLRFHPKIEYMEGK